MAASGVSDSRCCMLPEACLWALLGVCAASGVVYLVQAVRAQVAQPGFTVQKLLYLLLVGASAGRTLSFSGVVPSIPTTVVLAGHETFDFLVLSCTSLVLFYWWEFHRTGTRRHELATVAGPACFFFFSLGILFAARLVLIFVEPHRYFKITDIVVKAFLIAIGCVLMLCFSLGSWEFYFRLRYSLYESVSFQRKALVRVACVLYIAFCCGRITVLATSFFEAPTLVEESLASAIDILSLVWWIVVLIHPGEHSLEWVLNPVNFSSRAGGLLNVGVLDSVSGGEGPSRSPRTPGSSSGSAECWICYDGGRCGKLIRPCKCRGSVAAVHESCLRQWVEVQEVEGVFPQCKVCGFRYKESEEVVNLMSCVVIFGWTGWLTVLVVLLFIVLVAATYGYLIFTVADSPTSRGLFLSLLLFTEGAVGVLSWRRIASLFYKATVRASHFRDRRESDTE